MFQGEWSGMPVIALLRAGVLLTPKKNVSVPRLFA
jgi:hypothetical protein